MQIEVPYVASLKEGQREIIILKCDSISKNKWVEHHQEEAIIGEPSHDHSTHRGDVDNDTDDVDKMLKVNLADAATICYIKISRNKQYIFCNMKSAF